MGVGGTLGSAGQDIRNLIKAAFYARPRDFFLCRLQATRASARRPGAASCLHFWVLCVTSLAVGRSLTTNAWN